jgi:hypothetical protein
VPLSKKEQDLLAQLQAKADEPAEPDVEVEWWEEDSDGNRRGGRMPWGKAKAIYGKWAPDLFADKDDDSDDEPEPKGKADAPPAARLFQGKRTG